jgi:hypothetical protein
VTATPEVAPPKGRRTETATCPTCDKPYVYNIDKDPVATHCGQLFCTAVNDWSPQEWALQARTSTLRETAGDPLNDLDRFALANHRPARNWWDITTHGAAA